MILITGHRGYIGSHLFDPADDVVGCDLKDPTYPWDFGDLIDNEYEVVVHLAASVSVVESFQEPEAYFTNNALKMSTFLERNTVDRMIFVSTGGAMYGNKRLAKEEDATWDKCLSPYAQSKFLAEMIVRQQIKNHVILRLANVYGGDYSVRGEAAVHKHFIEDDPIRVYGGWQTRDFIHVNDVCKAIRRAMTIQVTGTFNIGSGIETPIVDIAKKFSLARSVHIIYENERPGEIQYVSLDSTRAREAGLLDR